MDAAAVIIVSAMAAIATLVIVSAGLAVVFGLMRVVNMAHGEFLMLGALTTTTLVLKLGAPLWLAMVAAAATGAAVGALLEIVLVSRIYQRRIVDTLLITFGVSLVMFQLAVDIFGTTPPGIETPLGAITIGAYSVPAYTLVLVAAAIGISVGLYLLFHTDKVWVDGARYGSKSGDGAGSGRGSEAHQFNDLHTWLRPCFARRRNHGADDFREPQSRSGLCRTGFYDSRDSGTRVHIGHSGVSSPSRRRLGGARAGHDRAMGRDRAISDRDRHSSI
jgi:hypothetical protein